MQNSEILGNILRERKLTVSVAESCTGGLISKLITDTAGSSDYFITGVVAYSNDAKKKILNVSEDTLKNFGAVSLQCAEEMVKGIRKLSDSHICIATTGIAGPTGGSISKPVGVVFCGFYFFDELSVEKIYLKGTRTQIREQAANFCLNWAIKRLIYG